MPTVTRKNVQIKNLADCKEYVPLVSKWLWKEWGQKNGEPVTDDEYRTAHCLKKKKVPMTFVAFYNDAPVGTFSLWTNDLENRQDLTPWLAALFVIPKMRGRGIGTLMQKHAIRKAKKLKYKFLYLITDHIGYYEKTGWKFLEIAPLCNGKKTRIYKFRLRR